MTAQPQPQARRPQTPAHREWYVVTGGGDSALRMTAGLILGETDSGALALNDPEPANQWIEFVFADSGIPWATIVTRDKSLRVRDATCLRHPLQLGATIRLPNNTLHISHDIRKPRLSRTVIEVVHRDIPQRLQDLVGPGLAEALAAALEPRVDAQALDSAEPSEPTEAARPPGEARADPHRDAPDDWSDADLTVPEPRRSTWRSSSTSGRRQMLLTAGVLALGTITLAVLVSVGERETARPETFEPVAVDTPPVSSPAETPVAVTAPPADAQAQTPASVESSGGALPPVADPVETPAETADAGREAQEPIQAPERPEPSSDMGVPADEVADAGVPTDDVADAGVPRDDVADAGVPADDVAAATDAADPDQEPEQVAMLPRAETETADPVDVPPLERRSSPETSATETSATDGDTDAVPTPAPVDDPPDAALVAELEAIGTRADAMAAELALQRDLRAADLALAQGRLTTPPETSAYTLYSRVLALDPASPEARRGLESLRQTLINRALAHLAGGDLQDARQTLQAAADAGASPTLVADLRNEVDYRQRLDTQRPEASSDSQ